MNVAYELRCPKCAFFISGYADNPGLVVGYCRKCSLRFEALPLTGVDIVKMRVRTFA